MNKYIPLFCIPLLPFLGCSTTPDMARYKADNAASRRLEKRIDDLSGTISLLVNDGNRLHSDLGEVKALTRDVQQKTDGLATSIRDLEERLNDVVSSLKEKTAATPPQPESPATPEGAHAAETKSPVANKTEDAQKEAVRLVVENTPKASEEKKSDEEPPIQSVHPVHQSLPEEKKAVEAPVVKQDLEATNTAKAQEVVNAPEVVAKIEEKVAVTPPAGAPTTEGKPVAEAAPKAPEEQKSVEAPSIHSVHQVLPEEKKAESTQTESETAKQTSEPKADAVPPKQDAAVANLLSEPHAREPYLKEAIGRLAEKVFPDNKGIRWNIISFDHKAHLTHTEAEPLQADLGYPRFKFVVSFKTPENPNIIGTYSFTNGQYTPYFSKKK